MIEVPSDSRRTGLQLLFNREFWQNLSVSDKSAVHPPRDSGVVVVSVPSPVVPTDGSRPSEVFVAVNIREFSSISSEGSKGSLGEPMQSSSQKSSGHSSPSEPPPSESGSNQSGTEVQL